MKVLVASVLLGFLATLAVGQEQIPAEWAVYDRPCSERKEILRDVVRTPFSVAAWGGTWFELESYRWHLNEKVDCLTSHYSWFFTRNYFAIERDGVIVRDFDLENDVRNVSLVYRSANGFLAFPDADPRTGMLNVTYDDRQDQDDVNYYILGTDYYSYAVTWGCEDLNENQSREYAWILTRVPNLNPELPDDANTLARIESYVDQYLDRDFLEASDQRDELCSNLRR